MKSKSLSSSGTKSGIVGAAMAALAASLCCVGPLVLLGLGVGGAWAGFLTFFEPFRPYLIVLTLGFLGYAFYKTYRKPTAEDCEPGSYCANPASDRRNKLFLWTFTLLIVGLLAVPSLTPLLSAGNVQTSPTPPMTKEVVLNVNGMTCTTCSITLQKRLGQLDGVLDSQASFETKTATIRYDPEKIAPSDLLKATQDIGYTAAVQQSPSGKESRDEY